MKQEAQTQGLGSMIPMTQEAQTQGSQTQDLELFLKRVVFQNNYTIGRLSYIELTRATGVFDPSSCSSVIGTGIIGTGIIGTGIIDTGIIDTGSEGRSMIMLCDTLEPSKEAMPRGSQTRGSQTPPMPQGLETLSPMTQEPLTPVPMAPKSKTPMARVTPMTQQKTSRLIPTGKYKVIVNHSNRFNRDLPLLINVAGFTGIRIHRGNSSKDTQGCILCKINDKAGWVSDSAKYEQKIIDLIRAYKECWITVSQ